MNDFQKYVILTAFKEFVKDLTDCYDEDGDEPICVFKAYIDNMNVFSENCQRTVDGLCKFFEENKFIFDDIEKDLETLECNRKNNGVRIKFDEDAYVDVYKYLSKDDGNSSVVYAHLKTLNHLAKGGSTSEEQFLEEFIEGFKNTLFSSSENLDENSFNQISDAIKPSVEKSLNTFKQKNLNVESFLKLICLKVKEHLTQNALPSVVGEEEIKKEDLIEILDLAIEKDIDELFQLKFQIMAMLSKSGLLARLPFDKILQMASSYGSREHLV